MAKKEMHSEKGEMKKDIAQDKKLIKKAIAMHDKQEHPGKKTKLAKLKKGGPTIMDMRKNHEVAPEPISTKAFSGKFMVRIPPQTHRTLAIQAAESGISLNRLVSSKLS